MNATELKQEIALLADKADNFLAAAEAPPLPPSFHIEQLSSCLSDISKRLKELQEKL